MRNYFDEYFDMVYYINLEKRKDRNESILNLFKEIGINNFQRIEAIDASQINENEIPITLRRGKRRKMSKSSYSCCLSHMNCFYDALENNYKKIMVFEDDACLNVENQDIRNNLYHHLKNCFDWLQNNKWSLFYFDNIKGIRLEDGKIIEYTRLENELNQNSILKLRRKHKKCLIHSYAVSSDDFIHKHLEYLKTNFDHMDVSFYRNKNVRRKFYYTSGIFDQKTEFTNDNDWKMKKA